MPTVIAKNQTGTPILLPRLGQTAPATPGTITLTDDSTFFEVAAEAELQTRISSADIIINDGTSDLSIADALAYLDTTGNLNGPTTSVTADTLFKMSGTTGRYTETTGITVDASDNLTTTGTVDAAGIEIGGSPLDFSDLAGATDNTPIIEVIKATAGTISLGDVVQIVGHNGTLPTIELADASAVATMPAIGIARETITDAASGMVVVLGQVSGINTVGFTEGNPVYVSETAGEFTATAPTGTALVQTIAIVSRVNASGVLEVVGAGTQADLPNLAQDTVWLGNGSGVPTATSRSGLDDTALHSDATSEISVIAEKTSPVSADLLVIEDSEAGNAKKRVQVGNLPGGGGGTAVDTYRWAVNGKPAVQTNIDGAWIAPRAGTITRITLFRRTAGSSGSTTVDVNINGTTVYTTQGNRPTVTQAGGANLIDATTDMDVTAVAQNDRLECDVDVVEAGNPQDIDIILEIEYT